MRPLILFFVFMGMGALAGAQYKTKHYCESLPDLKKLSQRVQIVQGRGQLKPESVPPMGTPEFVEYQLKKKCFFHHIRPTSATEVTKLQWVGQRIIADEVFSKNWKVEFFRAQLDFKSKKVTGFFMTPPCEVSEKCVSVIEKEWDPLAEKKGGEPLCEDWPQWFAGSSPALALAGLELGYRFRSSCDLGERFQILGWRAQLRPLEEGSPLIPALYIQGFSMPAGYELYRLVFKPPSSQPGGLYGIQGCIRVRDQLYDETKCLPIPEPDPYYPVELVPQS